MHNTLTTIMWLQATLHAAASYGPSLVVLTQLVCPMELLASFLGSLVPSVVVRKAV